MLGIIGFLFDLCAVSVPWTTSFTSGSIAMSSLIHSPVVPSLQNQLIACSVELRLLQLMRLARLPTTFKLCLIRTTPKEWGSERALRRYQLSHILFKAHLRRICIKSQSIGQTSAGNKNGRWTCVRNLIAMGNSYATIKTISSVVFDFLFEPLFFYRDVSAVHHWVCNERLNVAFPTPYDATKLRRQTKMESTFK